MALRNKITILFVFAGLSLSLSFGIFGAFSLFPVSKAFAHEVYVLPSDRVQYGQAHPSPNPFSALGSGYSPHHEDQKKFVAWGAAQLALVLIIIFLSWKNVFKFADPFFRAIRPYAATIARVILGISFIYSAH